MAMAESKAPTIAVFTKNTTNPAYTAARLGADRTAARLGAHTVHYVPREPDNVEEQIALIDQALATHPDAVVLVPVHPTAVLGAIRKIYAAGIPVFAYINRFTEQGPVTFVGSEDHPLGLKIASYLCEHLNAQGEVVVMEGPPESVTGRERLRGFNDALEQYPEVKIVATINGQYLPEPSRRVAAELLQSGIHFDGVIAANDVMALAMIETLETAGRKSVVVGVNAIPQAITAIKEGKLLATVDFDAMKMGMIATEAAIRYLRGEKVPAEIVLPVQIVDRTNCTDWDKPFAERRGITWEEAVGSAT
jgi:ribose transport system substrate-binding protein